MKQLITQHEILTLDDYGRIVSFSSGYAPDQEFIQPGDYPVLSFQYREKDRLIDVESIHDIPEIKDFGQEIEYTYTDIEDTGVTAVCRIIAGPDNFSFTISLTETNGLCITGVSYPFIIVRYQLEGTPNSEALHYLACPPAGSGL